MHALSKLKITTTFTGFEVVHVDVYNVHRQIPTQCLRISP